MNVRNPIPCGLFITLLMLPAGCSSDTPQPQGEATLNQPIHQPGYLEPSDPVFVSIKNRAVADLKQSLTKSNPELPENQALAAQVEAMPEEKQEEVGPLFEKSINDYAVRTQFEKSVGSTPELAGAGYLMVLGELQAQMKEDESKVAAGWDIRVQYLGDTTYVAEFWKDQLEEHSEANAIAITKDRPEATEKVKQNYANQRQYIADGTQPRYTQSMALLYTMGKDGSITFHEPLQPLYDFVKNNAK